ncbi:short-chain dehydrogenase/reductase [Niastella yeongjuensis]|uniref:Short-chain dehydrogenase/reductase n=1 Tax=Niastella yeongjuensis TaxID=354355 RepID=A0A1V9EE81_9BACT|nr:SDR family oxidoreductase [Niastella yeongjuensis]OQP44426.1 short-chain dehydrogenase/reductase [Niastella yeongjuensis]SEO88079.1 Short-chain dehydrogenase [Niastella yeongjuensis]
MENKKVWYITGASKGMGLSLAKQLLAAGHTVAATSRNITALTTAIEPTERFLPLQVDLASEQSIAASLQHAFNTFGRIDVIVNNAGYGIGGALEELSTEEIAANFDVNFFAIIRVIQQAMPYLRRQGFGHLINISSIAGFAPGVGWSVYAAAKFAVSGLSEALANDLKPLGIRVTAVSPGWFRTSFAKPESIAFGKKQIEDYQYIRTFHEKFNQMDGLQAGDPDKIAAALMQLVTHPNPPVNLFLGTDAYNRAASKIAQLSAQLEEWGSVSASTDFTI